MIFSDSCNVLTEGEGITDRINEKAKNMQASQQSLAVLHVMDANLKTHDARVDFPRLLSSLFYQSF